MFPGYWCLFYWLNEKNGHRLLICLQNIQIDKPDVRDQTPLFAAVKYNHIENAKILLDFGSNPNGIGASSESPVHVAVRDGFTSMIEVLLSHGASPDGRESGLKERLQNFKIDSSKSIYA